MVDTIKPNTILSFDTTGRQDSIAVSVDGKVTSKLLPQGGSGLQSAILVPELKQLLCHVGRVFPDVDLVCVLTGPGSFTGIRLGLATAQGLKLATGCDIFAPTLLDLLVSLADDAIAVVDSKRGDYFIKMDGVVSAMKLSQIQEIALTRLVVSTELIPGIDVILPKQPIAHELISFYQRCLCPNHFQSLEPFYFRVPEFARKKPFIPTGNESGIHDPD